MPGRAYFLKKKKKKKRKEKYFPSKSGEGA